jgi:hypothetical protein
MTGSAADPVSLRGDDGLILSAEGMTALGLRRFIQAFVGLKWRVARLPTEPLPVALTAYRVQQALHICRILDKDVESMRTIGYTDEHAYKVTLVGAFGAALVELE